MLREYLDKETGVSGQCLKRCNVKVYNVHISADIISYQIMGDEMGGICEKYLDNISWKADGKKRLLKSRHR